MTKNRSIPALGAGLALSLLLGACGGGDSSEAVTRPGVSTSTLAEEEPPSDPGEVAAGDTTTAPSVSPDEGASTDPEAGSEGESEPVASQEAETANFDEESVTVRLDVLSLTRGSGDTVRLELRLTNLSEEFEYDLYTSLGAGSGYTVSGVSLVDLAGGKRYLVLQDSEGDCVCSEVDAEIEAGGSRTFEATFPAPPAEVAVLDVHTPTLGTLADVPLADA
ncbi:hypothetical protein BH24ACT4_BH24ACT4_14650 [soil metagenome]